MAYTQEQIKANIDALIEQGAKPEEIQGWLDSLEGQVQTEKAKEPGFLQKAAQAIAKPLLKVPTTVAAGGARTLAGLLGGEEAAQRAQERGLEGIDYPFFGNIKPIGAEEYKRLQRGEITVGDFIRRSSIEALGVGVEMYSYAKAPLKLGKGFWLGMKEGWKPAAYFGTGVGLQEYGEGKSVGEAIVSGIFTGGTALGFYGALKGVSGFLGRWGARAMRSTIFEKSVETLGKTMEKTINQIRGLGQLTQITPSMGRVINAARRKYNDTLTAFRNSSIDSQNPAIDDVNRTFIEFYESLGAEKGNYYRATNKLWTDVKADSTKITGWESVAKFLKEKYNLKDNTEEAFILKNIVESDKKGGLSLKQIMIEHERALRATSQGKTNEEQAFLREYAFELYNHAKNELGTSNPELLGVWNEAWRVFQDTNKIFSSPILNKLSSVGRIDSFIDDMISNRLSSTDREVLVKAIDSMEDPTAFQKLFMDGILRRAKQLDLKGSAKLLDDFNTNWGELILNKDQMDLISDIAAITRDDFDTIILSPLKEQKMSLEILENARLGKYEKIAEDFNLFVKDNPNALKDIQLLSLQDRQLVGSSLFHDVFKKDLEILNILPNDKIELNMDFVNAFKASIDRMNNLRNKNPEIINQLMTPEQIKWLNETQDIFEIALKTENIPSTLVARLFHGLGAVILYGIGSVRGGTGYALRTVAPSGHMRGRREYYQAVDEAINGVIKDLKPNFKMQISDFIDYVLSHPAVMQALEKATLGE